MKKYFFSVIILLTFFGSSFANNSFNKCPELYDLSLYSNLKIEEYDKNWLEKDSLIEGVLLLKGKKELSAAWWKTALADAGGALAGAGSVASILGYAGAASNPYGWGAVAVGGVIGGVWASVEAGSMKDTKNNGENTTNPNNELDDMGQKHNEIVLDFRNEGVQRNPQSYLAFISENSEEYGIEENYLTENFLANLSSELSTVNSVEDMIQFNLNKLPSEISESGVGTFLDEISSIQNTLEAINAVRAYEDSFFSTNQLNQTEKAIMKTYFSVLRHSLSLWDEN